jgi:hypothetical protein
MGLRLPSVMPLLTDAAYVAGGAVATEMISGIVARQFPALTINKTGLLVTKGAVALGLGMVAARFLGKRQGMLVSVGGLTPIVTDLLKTVMSGVPMLASATAATALPAPATTAIGESLNGVGFYAPKDGTLGMYAPLLV